MHRLENPVRDYPWGSATVIPELLGRPADGTPQAELWVGAHPDTPSRLADAAAEWPAPGARAAAQTLDELVAADPVGALGREVVAAFGPRLPFLLKVLAVEQPLSLQAHPSIAQAREGYAAENDAGVAPDAAERTYRDDNHKPEMLCALTPFDALCGFRPVERTAELLAALDVPGLRPDVDRLAAGDVDLRELVRSWLTMPAERVRAVVAELGTAAAATGHDQYGRELATIGELARAHPEDGGVLVATLLNRVRLEPGEAVFLPAGNLHAYLHGVGIEIMASSDNVLRGGLTSKHVDVDGLLSILDVTPGQPTVVHPVSTPLGEAYDVPISDFALTVLRPREDVGYALPAGSPQLLLVVEGTARLGQTGTAVELRRGESVFVAADEPPVQVAGSGVVVRASTRYALGSGTAERAG